MGQLFLFAGVFLLFGVTAALLLQRQTRKANKGVAPRTKEPLLTQCFRPTDSGSAI